MAGCKVRLRFTLSALVPMPFTAYQTTLDPETLKAAQQAFDLAWTEIIALPNGLDTQLARDLLAKRIISAAIEHGVRDPDRMKAYALAGLNPLAEALP